jgi:hypothetical protein
VEVAEDGGWINLVASLKKRYASTHRVAEDDRNEQLLDPIIASSIEKITCLPTNDDYGLWRIRCKVFLTSVTSLHVIHLSSQAWKKRSYFLYFN